MSKKVNISSIRFKLNASFISICLIPLLILSTVAYFRARSILTERFQISTNQTLKEINRGIDNYFQSFVQPIEMLSRNVNFVEFDILEERATFAKMTLKDFTESDEDIFSICYGSEQGKYTVYPEGDMGKNYNHKEHPWYKDSITNKDKVIISQPFPDAMSGTPLVAISKAVERDGKAVGVVCITISLEHMSEVMSDIKVGKGGYLYITDLNGSIISHPDKELIGKDDLAKLDFWKDVQTKSTGFSKYSYEGQNKYASFDVNATTNWRLIGVMDESELSKDVEGIGTLMGIILLIFAATSVFISYLLSKGIADNVNKLNVAFAKTAQGDLTVAAGINSKDEFESLGNNFEFMLQNISDLFMEVDKSAKTILETAGSLASTSEETTASVVQVTDSINEIDQGASRTAESTQNSAKEISDLSDSVNKITIAAEDIGNISDESKKLSAKGLEIVQILGDKSSRTKESTLQVSEIVKDMDISTERINSISDVISSITEQTNLLSLNASIEAARAGEWGKGFAVVADEIRKLAEESKQSAEEIKKIVETIKTKSSTAVDAMSETKVIVEEQYNSVHETQKIFSEMMNGINHLTESIQIIKNDTREIAVKKNSLVTQIEEVTAISQETAAATEEVSASAQEINATMEEVTRSVEGLQLLAEKLENNIDKFKIS